MNWIMITLMSVPLITAVLLGFAWLTSRESDRPVDVARTRERCARPEWQPGPAPFPDLALRMRLWSDRRALVEAMEATAATGGNQLAREVSAWADQAEERIAVRWRT